MDDLDITRVHPRNPLDDLIGDLKRRKPAPVPFARHLDHYPTGWREPTWWESVGLDIYNAAKAAKAASRFVALILTLLYHFYTGDIMAIIRSLVALVLAILAQYLPGASDFQILGYGLDQLLTWAFLIVAGLFLPQARHWAPAFIRELFKWQTEKGPNDGR